MDQLKLHAVLWDMDGTILDSDPIWSEAEFGMLQRYGIPLTEETRKLVIGSGLWDAAEHFRELGVPLSADDIVAEWVAHVGPAISRGEAGWRPGARELLESLRVAGVPCALVTMSVRSLANRLVDLLPEGTFSVVIAGDEVQFAKPHPEAYLRAAELLNVPISQCLVIEDSPTGLTSGMASGAVTVGVPNMVSLTHAPAHDLWESLADRDAVTLQSDFTAMRG